MWKKKSKQVKRWVYLSECKEGDWVYYDAGELVMVEKSDIADGFTLTSGYIRSYVSDDTIVYPLTIHAKIIAEGIHKYYDRMHKSRLINGSHWVNWLSEKMDELMALPDDADGDEYRKIWNSIEQQINELEYHKSFLN